MKSSFSIQLKAAILLAVFALNTLVGFACSVGIDMGFNSSHHHDKEATEAVVHIHKDGKEHIHHEAKSHHHDEANHKTKGAKDDCCKDKVVKLEQLDKSVPQPFAAIQPIFFTAFISSFFNVDVSATSQVVPNIRYFVRSYHPPISDIRIAIQSFQI